MLVVNYTDGPLCPYGAGLGNGDPRGIIHRLMVTATDILYDNFDKNDDNEFISEEANRVYDKFTERFNDRMRLFHEVATTVKIQGIFCTVKSSWFQCNICGYVLTATIEEDPVYKR